jgi:hypothetical protein
LRLHPTSLTHTESACSLEKYNNLTIITAPNRTAKLKIDAYDQEGTIFQHFSHHPCLESQPL